MRTSRSSKILLVVVTLLALIIEVPQDTLGQLEAMGAVLSVVPVTSILATAGLVGVKLAALSRLLNVLGYDRAYLAQNLGTGTAASPIGLQTRYAYMFPYVPGVNISVKGEDSIGMPKETAAELGDMDSKGQNGAGETAIGANRPPSRRKPFPSMILPANYEHQAGPFRGSDALKEIFDTAGLQAHFPTASQQQQLQQQFNLPQDKPSATTNNQQQQQQQQQIDGSSQPNPDPSITNHGTHAFIPSNVAPNRQTEMNSALPPPPPSMGDAVMTDGVGSGLSMATVSSPAADHGEQPGSRPSSSNFHQVSPPKQQQQPTSSNQNRSPSGRDQVPASASATQQHFRKFEIQF